jgi:hypothetical protein
MIKGRMWRFLTIFLTLYVIFLLYSLRTFISNTIESTTLPSLPAKIEIIEPRNQPNLMPKPIVIRSAEENLSNLEPVMTKDVLGNYEPKNINKASGPGEDGAGVQLQGDEEKKLGDKSVAEYGFNEVASEKISLNRRARDTR